MRVCRLDGRISHTGALAVSCARRNHAPAAGAISHWRVADCCRLSVHVRVHIDVRQVHASHVS